MQRAGPLQGLVLDIDQSCIAIFHAADLYGAQANMDAAKNHQPQGHAAPTRQPQPGSAKQHHCVHQQHTIIQSKTKRTAILQALDDLARHTLAQGLLVSIAHASFHTELLCVVKRLKRAKCSFILRFIQHRKQYFLKNALKLPPGAEKS